MNKLERAVRLGLDRAAGKSMEDAVRAMLDCLELVLDVDAPVPAAVPSRPVHAPPADPGILRQLTDLAPIESSEEAPTTKKIREWWTISDLHQKILDEAPAYLEVTPDGRTAPLSLGRTVLQMTGISPGVMLAYKVAGADDNVPYPRETFWVTTEVIDIDAAVAKMKADAEKMYRVRDHVVRQGIAPNPSIRYVNMGEV